MPSKSEPTLTFLNGTDTIGGVQAVIRADNSALFFDFGTTPNPAGSLFSRPSPPPREHTLAAHLRAGMAPLVEGLYNPVQLALSGGSVAAVCEPLRCEGRMLDGVPLLDDLEHVGCFVSHVHNDHCGLLPFVSPDVPVIMSSDGAAVHAGLVEVGALAPCPARVRGLDDGGRVRIGDIQLELASVDHDIPGASGIVLEAGDYRVAWTGDWRAHGHSPERMVAFAERATGVDLLITEGTTLRPDSSPVRPLSEMELTERADRLLAGTDGLAFVTPYPRNLNRLASLRDAAAANGRTLVLRPETLAAWRAAVRHGLTGPDPDGGTRPIAALAIDAGVDGSVSSTDPQIGVEDLRRDRNGFLVELQVPDRWIALAVGAGPGDLLIHCNGEPLGPWTAEWTSLTAWVEALGLDFVWLDSGGHATPDDLAWLVETVRPKTVVAVHSAHPQLFPHTGVPLVLPRRGHTFPLSHPTPLGRGVRGGDSKRTVNPCAL